MAHGFWTIIDGIGYGIRAFVLYFASILKNLTWPQVFLAFLLLFPRQIKNLLITLNRLLEKVKTLHWGELKGEIEETSKAVEKAEQSKEEVRDKSATDTALSQAAHVIAAMVPPIGNTPLLTGENVSEEYSRFLEGEARMEAELSSLGIPLRRSPRSPIERFLSVSQAIEASLSRLYFLYGLQDPAIPQASSVARMAAGLLGVGVLTEEMYDSFGKYQRLRNRIVHISASETEVIDAFLLGRRLYGLIQSIPLPDYRVLEPAIPVSDDPAMQDSFSDIHVVIVENPKVPKRIAFLTTTDFNKGMIFVPTSNPNDKLRGYFYFSLDGQLRRIVGQGLDLAILYSRK